MNEAGHAFFALLLGREVTRITIARDSSGETTHTGSKNKLVLMIVTFAGYPAPSLAGWGIISAILAQQANIAVGVIILITVLFLPLQRNIIAIIVTITIALIGLFLTQVSETILVFFFTLFAGYLLGASLKTIFTLCKARKILKEKQEIFSSDSTILSSLTKTPLILWEGLFLLTSTTILIYNIINIIGSSENIF